MEQIVKNCDHRWGGTCDIGDYLSQVCGRCGATRTTAKTRPETRRHNGFGVDLIGGSANLDMAFLALNSHADLLAALKNITRRWTEFPKPPTGRDAEMYWDDARAALAKAEGGAE